MMGRNHGIVAATGWLAAAPTIAATTGVELDTATLAVTTVIAAGAGVVPDLDHPDSGPARSFGILSRIVATGLNAASGGHRAGTHSLPFAALAYLGGWAAITLTDSPLPAAIIVGFCITVGLALLGPSLGFRIPAIASVGTGIAAAGATLDHADAIAPMLPALLAYGVLIHIACDIVTKGGVPLLYPFSKRKYALGLFRTNGLIEGVLSVVFVLVLLAVAGQAFASLPTTTA